MSPGRSRSEQARVGPAETTPVRIARLEERLDHIEERLRAAPTKLWVVMTVLSIIALLVAILSGATFALRNLILTLLQASPPS